MYQDIAVRKMITSRYFDEEIFWENLDEKASSLDSY
jgi:hypothetical protein